MLACEKTQLRRVPQKKRERGDDRDDCNDDVMSLEAHGQYPGAFATLARCLCRTYLERTARTCAAIASCYASRQVPTTGVVPETTMTNRLETKTALITGAGQGIGRATAKLFTAEGARVIATDLAIPRSCKGSSCSLARLLDVTDRGRHRRASDARVGAIDVLFNCAGVVQNGTVLESADEVWAHTFDVNVISMARTIRAFLPGMIAKGGGAIVNVASVASSIKGVVNRCAYSASKAAVIGLTKSVAIDFVTKGIRCNAICPGTVDSPSLRQRWENTGDYDGARKRPLSRVSPWADLARLRRSPNSRSIFRATVLPSSPVRPSRLRAEWRCRTRLLRARL
jgi:2-keto-3-deoxy-L-fuconate dehydrogenase